MFLLRSAFWLTLAFVIIRPGVDVGQAASTLSSQAMGRGSQFIAAQIKAVECETIQCAGGRALASAALQVTLPASNPTLIVPASDLVPLPRPRPDREG